jgi:aldehyde dehydrogenase (NAD+)
LINSPHLGKIIATGGTFLGKLISAAAAKTLTPVLLELGGKNPCIIDETCNIEKACKKIAFGSFTNSG